MPTLGVVVLSLGRTEHLAECLRSVAWADKVLLVQAGGGEPEIGSSEWPSLRIQSVASPADADKHLAEIGTDWVLQLWAEERLEAELAETLQALCRGESRNGSGSYRIAVRSHILGAWVEGSVSGPSPAVRLSRNIEALRLGWWIEARSAETLVRGCIRDYGCSELARAVERVQELSDFWAARLQGAASAPGALGAALGSLKVFFKMLLLNRFFSRGIAGVALSALASYAVLLSGAKLWEAKHGGAKRK
ncbi:MAG TPA: hypothetical protein VGL70_08550 [Candidatus Binatia bacterium]|jgi:hypothetical protein